MPTNDNLEKIRKACQVANEDIMKLQFGCEFRYFNNLDSGKNKICISYKAPFMFYLREDGETRNAKGELGDFEILGRPIQWHDILLALGEKYAIDGAGMLLERAYGTDNYNCSGCPKIDLTKPLDDQSEEVKSFIASLLP